MKILHVVPGLSRWSGGPSESVPMTAMAQLRVGAEVGIAACESLEESLKAAEAAASGVKMYRFGYALNFSLNPMLLSLEMVRKFEAVAKEYDVLTLHCNWMFPIWWAAHVARKLGKPYYMMPRGSFAPERLSQSAWKKKLVGWIDRHYARHAAAVWATAESEARAVKTYVPEAKVEVFPIGLDVGKYEKVKGRGEGEGEGGRSEMAEGRRERRTLLYLSRISPIKGLDLLAEAWARHCREVKVKGEGELRWQLLIVGSDDRGYAKEIEKVFAAKCPAGSFEFRGPVYGEEKMKLLASADAFVLPTRNENWGIAVAEAMASGLPVICTKGAPWSCLEAERTGRWVDVSVEGIQKGIEDILALSDDARRAMGERARAWACENLNWKAIAQKMVDSIREEYVLRQ